MGNQGVTTENKRNKVLLFIALALLPAILYANTLPNSFQYDDTFFILSNQYVHDLSGVGHFFVSPRLISNIPLSGYRPLTMATFALNYALGGDSAVGYHLFNVAIHVLNTLLVYGFSLTLMRAFGIPRDRYSALVVAFLFACHPINTQPVNYISGRSTLLAGCFALICFLLYAAGRESPGTFQGFVFLAGSLLAYACALCSKEEAVAVPGLLLAYELCRFRLRIDKGAVFRIFFNLLPILVFTIGFIIFVVHILGIVQDTQPARGMWENLLTQSRALFIYLQLIAAPSNLSIDHVVAPSTSILEPSAMASVVAVVAVLAGSVLVARSVPLVSFGIWWFMLALAPSSTLIALKLVVNEQRLYLPAIGMMLVAAAGFGTALERAASAGEKYSSRALTCGLAILLIILSALTMKRNTEWRTPLSLWTSALEEYPESGRATTQIANIYMGMGRFEEALEAAREAVKIVPDVPEARVTLAMAYSQSGLLKEALAEARAAVGLNPGSSDAQIVLGTVYAQLERYEEAEAAWQRALELDPQNVAARENLEKLKGTR
jgi:tetratricopeptide (TPR) repeat protein